MNGSQPGSDSDFGDYSTKYGDGLTDVSLSKRFNNYGTSPDNVHFKILVPAIATGAVIGKKGDAIAKIQKETGAKVKMSKSNDFYPGTMERVCLILGSVDAIMRVHDYIMDKILEKPEMPVSGMGPGATSLSSMDLAGVPSNTGDSSMSGGAATPGNMSWFGNRPTPTSTNAPNTPPTLLTRMQSLDGSAATRFPTERHKQVKILVPNSTAGMIIGKGGQFIKEIKDTSNAYVQISQKSKDSSLSLPERCVIIAGERENNRIAVRMILQKIAEDPQSSTCPQISYADCSGPLPSAYPTGSPFAVVTSGGNGVSPSNMYHNTPSASGTGPPNNAWNKSNVGPQGSTVGGLWPPVEPSLHGGMSGNLPNPSNTASMTPETLQFVRQWLLSAGYSDQAAKECLQAFQVLSQYGLFNHQTLLNSNGGSGLTNAINSHNANNSSTGGNSLHLSTGLTIPGGASHLAQGLFGSGGQQQQLLDGSGLMSPNSHPMGNMSYSGFNYQFTNSPGPFSPMGFGIGNSYSGGGSYPAPFSPQLSGSIAPRMHHNSESMPLGGNPGDTSLPPMQPLMIYNPPGGMSTPLSSLFSPSSSYNFGGMMDSSVGVLQGQQWSVNVTGMGGVGGGGAGGVGVGAGPGGLGSTSSIIDPSTGAFVTGGAVMSPYANPGTFVTSPPSMSAFSPIAGPPQYINMPAQSTAVDELTYSLTSTYLNPSSTMSNVVSGVSSSPNVASSGGGGGGYGQYGTTAATTTMSTCENSTIVVVPSTSGSNNVVNNVAANTVATSPAPTSTVSNSSTK